MQRSNQQDISHREIPCPKCGAEAGRACKLPSGYILSAGHAERRGSPGRETGHYHVWKAMPDAQQNGRVKAFYRVGDKHPMTKREARELADATEQKTGYAHLVLRCEDERCPYNMAQAQAA